MAGAAVAPAPAFECDAFFPAFAEGVFGEGKRSAPKVENGLKYEFVEWVPRASLPDLTDAPGAMPSAAPHGRTRGADAPSPLRHAPAAPGGAGPSTAQRARQREQGREARHAERG